MTEDEKIIDVLERYMVAAKDADQQALQEFCTDRLMTQFGWFYRFSMRCVRVFFPRRISNLELKDVTVESVKGEKAVAHYTVTWGNKHRYERVVLLKDGESWKVDGKFV
ncbi:hypothetical protein ACFSW8_05290 [Rubritalea tangerina]|uniref:Uncharacterized protein n=2 Tax=Rubritalea tangerina TaxID=430798 RepID=A0ABW4Z975_9BACT